MNEQSIMLTIISELVGVGLPRPTRDSKEWQAYQNAARRIADEIIADRNKTLRDFERGRTR
jgi:hypothetical protein